MVSLAIASRRKELWFSSVFVLFSVLPVIFIEVRGSIFVLYIPFFGWVLYAATLLILIRTGVCRFIRRIVPHLFHAYRWNGAILSTATFAATALYLGSVHKAHTGPVALETAIQSTLEQIHEIVPLLPANSSLLLIGDPFSTDEWTPLFAVRLSYGDETIRVDRTKMMPRMPELKDLKEYTAVLAYRGNRFIRIDPAGI